MESTELIPLTGDVAKITRRAEEFRDLHEALQKNLQTYLTLTMDALSGVQQRVKSSMVAETTKQAVRGFSQFIVFVLLIPFLLFASLPLSDTGKYQEKVSFAHGVCWYLEIPHVSRRLFVSRQTWCGDRTVVGVIRRSKLLKCRCNMMIFLLLSFCVMTICFLLCWAWFTQGITWFPDSNFLTGSMYRRKNGTYELCMEDNRNSSNVNRSPTDLIFVRLSNESILKYLGI